MCLSHAESEEWETLRKESESCKAKTARKGVAPGRDPKEIFPNVKLSPKVGIRISLQFCVNISVKWTNGDPPLIRNVTNWDKFFFLECTVLACHCSAHAQPHSGGHLSRVSSKPADIY